MLSKRGLNPVQAESRKKKKREQIKVREERAKRHEERLSHRNMSQMERQLSELTQLESSQGLNAHDKQLLQNLQRDMAIMKKKNIHGHRVGRVESDKTKEAERQHKPRKPFIPKNPKRSIYYDPIFNPYGVPPPGMPYREKEELSSETDESVIDIPLPSEEYPFEDPKPREKKNKSFKPKHHKKQDINATSAQPKSTTTTEAAANTKDIEEETMIEYSAQPVVRDLRQEAAQFLPAAFQRQKLAKGQKIGQPDRDVSSQVQEDKDEEIDNFYKEIGGYL
ncbi:Protein saf1 [Schizosaccharomyces pombe]